MKERTNRPVGGESRSRSISGQTLVMASERAAAKHEDLVRELQDLAHVGVGRLREISTPTLRLVAESLDLMDEGDLEPAPVVRLLRDAVDGFGGGDTQDQAEYLLGLRQGTELWPVKRRQNAAAESADMNPETFRKDPQRQLLSLFADKVLDLLYDKGLRHARLAMEQHRHPADSRLAVQWVERFEAYNRIWTPVWALGADLEAALHTYGEQPAEHPPWDQQSDKPWDPVARAQEYARDALYDYASYHLELKRFKSRHGGMWLMSSPEVETETSDAIYRIGWQNSFTRDEDALLRRTLADSRLEENDHFWRILLSTSAGQRIHDAWQELVRDGVGREGEDRNASHAWLTIEACQDYCRLIDEDWVRIADWYRPESKPSRGVNAKDLYDKYVTRRENEEA